MAAEAGDSGTHRRCLVTRETHDRSVLIRFVVGPGGELVADLAGRLPGRGLWLTACRDIVEQAVAKRLFARAAKQAVAVPPALADRVEALLVQRCVDAIGLARRAGLAVAGFERVCEALRGGKAAMLLAAVDGAEGGRRKLQGLGRGLPLAGVLTAAEMGAAFGREHVVNASLGSGPLCRRLLLDAEKLAGFRPNAAVGKADGPFPAGRRGRMTVLERDDRRD
ncbi:MAG: RNA-binding protein [Stellaceae bacterium]